MSGKSDLVNDSKAMHDALRNIQGMIKELTTGQIHHLQLVRSSPKYVDRLVDNLKQKLRFVDRCLSKNVDLATKREAAIQEQAEAQRKFKMLSKNVKSLQTNIEKDISKRYKNRRVNIQGVQLQ